MPSADPAGPGVLDAAGPNLLDVDIGGTFTDAFVVLGGRQATGKSLTTHADLSDGMIVAIGEAARRLGGSAASPPTPSPQPTRSSTPPRWAPTP